MNRFGGRFRMAFAVQRLLTQVGEFPSRRATPNRYGGAGWARFPLIAFCCLVSACSTVSGDLSTNATMGYEAGANRYRDLEIVSNLPPPNNTNQGIDALISADDVLEIKVFQVDQLDRTVKVDPKGMISLPLIGAVVAAGRTVLDLETEIESKYAANYLQNPDVAIYVKEAAGQRITVDGAVAKPGIYSVASNSTLLNVMAQAGGFVEVADARKVYVFRDFGDKKLAANFDVDAIRAGRAPDPRIYGGDVIVSFASDMKIAAKNLREALGIATSAAVFAAL